MNFKYKKEVDTIVYFTDVGNKTAKITVIERQGLDTITIIVESNRKVSKKMTLFLSGVVTGMGGMVDNLL